MKEPYPRIFPIWFLPVLVLIGFSMMQCGCRTGGTWLGKGSAGTVIVPQTPQEINENNRLRENPPFSLEPLAPIPIIPQSTPVPEAPRATKATSPETLPITPKYTEPSPAKSPPTNLIAGDGGCVKHDPAFPQPSSDNVEKSTNNSIIIAEEKDMKVNWVDLFMFYAVCVLALLTVWMLYDIIKKYIKNKLDKRKSSPKIKAVKKKKKAVKKKAVKKITKKK